MGHCSAPVPVQSQLGDDMALISRVSMFIIICHEPQYVCGGVWHQPGSLVWFALTLTVGVDDFANGH